MKTRSNSVFTCNALHDKEKRSLAILELIRKKGIISRTDISRATGINVVSVSNYITSFIEKKLVLEKGHAVSSGGRKPELVELNIKENLCVGIDICAENISAILADIGMNIIAKKKAARPENKREVAPAVISLIEDVIRSSGVAIESVKAIGIGVCCESILPVRDDVEKKFNVDTLIGDAATCGAYAEKKLNPAAAAEKLLFIHSDLGRGIFIDGDIFTGCIGHSGKMEVPTEIQADAINSYAEKLKYLNPWSPYLGMVKIAKREVARGVGTKIVSLSGGDIEKITEEVMIDAARQDDETALNIVQSVAITMGLRIAYLINLFGPDVVVIGGGPEKAEDLTFPLINKMVKRLSLKKYADTIKIIPCSLGDDGLCMGAAALAVREVFLKS
jgi:predicted NBD/HSP70 family sugar kinase